MEIRIIQFRQLLFQRIDIFQGAGLRHITAVQQDMHPHLMQAFFFRLLQHGKQVIDMGMDIAVRKQAQEMHDTAMFLYLRRGFGPGFRRKDRTAVNGFLHQLGTLRINLSAAQGIVSDLGIAHVTVGRQADSRARSSDCRMRPDAHQFVQLRFICVQNSVLMIHIGPSDAVHHDQYNRFRHIC